MNRALGRFSIGIGNLSDRYPTVYSVAFLQLYNHLVEGTTVHHCATERSDRAFIRQHGRAAFRQRRTTASAAAAGRCRSTKS